MWQLTVVNKWYFLLPDTSIYHLTIHINKTKSNISKTFEVFFYNHKHQRKKMLNSQQNVECFHLWTSFITWNCWLITGHRVHFYKYFISCKLWNTGLVYNQHCPSHQRLRLDWGKVEISASATQPCSKQVLLIKTRLLKGSDWWATGLCSNRSKEDKKSAALSEGHPRHSCPSFPQI